MPAVAAIVAFEFAALPDAEETAAVVAAAAAAAAVAFVAPEDTPATNQTALNCVVDKLQLASWYRIQRSAPQSSDGSDICGRGQGRHAPAVGDRADNAAAVAA